MSTESEFVDHIKIKLADELIKLLSASPVPPTSKSAFDVIRSSLQDVYPEKSFEIRCELLHNGHIEVTIFPIIVTVEFTVDVTIPTRDESLNG